MKLGFEFLIRYDVMSRKRNKFSVILWLELDVLRCTFLILSFLHLGKCFHKDSIVLNGSPTNVKKLNLPYKTQYDIGYFNKYQFKPKEPLLPSHPTITIEKYFQIEPSDAIDGVKYSQPAVSYEQFKSYANSKVPSLPGVKDKQHAITPEYHKPTNFHEHPLSMQNDSSNSSKSLRDLRFMESVSDYKITEDKLDIFQSDMHFNEDSNSKTRDNNFTDSQTNLLPVSSDTVLSYENLSSTLDKNIYKDLPVKKSEEGTVEDKPSHFTESSKSTDSDSESLLPVLTQFTTQTSDGLSTHVFIDLMNQTDIIESTKATKSFPSLYDENVSSSSPSLDNESVKLSSGTVAAIVIAVLVCVTILSSTVIYLLYRKYNGKCTSVVEGKFNSDNCGYLDDSLRSSIYLNNHIELPKESSEEMSSLDNDSFLNSLETMTIQNYWADNSKNTKV